MEQIQKVYVGLDEAGVGRSLEVHLGPVEQRLAQIEERLAGKLPVPESADPLLVKAVELYNEGVDLYKTGDVSGAIRKYIAAIELDLKCACVHINLGIALRDKGDLDRAIEEFSKAIDLDPKYGDAHYNLACVYALRGSAPEAVTALKTAIELDGKCLDLAKTDSDFDRIRDDPEFRKLVYGE